MKLKIEELVVTSFATATEAAAFRPTTDPTPDSGCFVCPIMFSEGCY